MMEKRFLSATCPGIELRFAAAADAETKAQAKAAEAVTGYAAKFGVRSQDLGGFLEVIQPGAFDDVLGTDVVALFNHDPNQPLARSTAGTLRISVDAVGLKYDFDLAGDECSQRVAAFIADGRVSQSSFSFRVAMDGDKWERLEDGVILRTINKVDKLYDVSPVTYPAYLDASVALRSEAFAEVTRIQDAHTAAERSVRAAARRRELELTQPR